MATHFLVPLPLTSRNLVARTSRGSLMVSFNVRERERGIEWQIEKYFKIRFNFREKNKKIESGISRSMESIYINIYNRVIEFYVGRQSTATLLLYPGLRPNVKQNRTLSVDTSGVIYFHCNTKSLIWFSIDNVRSKWSVLLPFSLLSIIC